MFGWLKSLFGSEPEAERIVPPPLPSKVKKAEKLVGKKIAKKTPPKKEVVKEVKPKEKTAKAPSKKKEVVKESVTVSTEETVPVTPAPKKKSGRAKKEDKVG